MNKDIITKENPNLLGVDYEYMKIDAGQNKDKYLARAMVDNGDMGCAMYYLAESDEEGLFFTRSREPYIGYDKEEEYEESLYKDALVWDTPMDADKFIKKNLRTP